MYRKLLEIVSIVLTRVGIASRDILQVFSVRQIQKCSRIQISPRKTTLHLGLDAIALLIFPAQQETKDTDQNGLDQVRDNHGPNAERVGRSVVRVSSVVLGIIELSSREEHTIDPFCRRMARQCFQCSILGTEQRW